MSDPLGSVHYPGSTGEFLSWFSSDADCMDYLAWLRWPDGFLCPTCASTDGGWRLGDGRFMCADCGARTSVTAGTIFDRTRTPLTVWFHACWMLATQKDGVSAQSLQRVLEIGSYQTAWAMLHRLRVGAACDPAGTGSAVTVEMDETYVGGDEPGLRGGRSEGQEGSRRLRRRAAPAKGLRPHRAWPSLPDANTRVAAPLPRRPRRAGLHCGHRRAGRLPGASRPATTTCGSSASQRPRCPACTAWPLCSSAGC